MKKSGKEERGGTSEELRVRDLRGCGTSLKWSLHVTSQGGKLSNGLIFFARVSLGSHRERKEGHWPFPVLR